MFIVVRHLNIWLEQLLHWSCCYFLKENTFYLFFPRQMPIDHLKCNNSEAPHITFEGIPIELQSLRRHIIRRPHVVVEFVSASL